MQYSRRAYGGEDVGELYDIEADPLERRNLYHDPAHQDTVAACRRHLLEWLIETTRVTTVWPYPDDRKAAFQVKEPFAQAEDGREPAWAGPAQRLALGRIGNFAAVDYL